MPHREEILERWNFFADRMSTQVRTIAIGLLATAWALLIGKLEVTRNMVAELETHFFLIGALAIFTLVLDFLQYLSGFLNTHKLVAKMDRHNLDEADYEYDVLYKLNDIFFWAKQVSIIACAFWFIGCLIAYYFFMNS